MIILTTTYYNSKYLNYRDIFQEIDDLLQVSIFFYNLMF